MFVLKACSLDDTAPTSHTLQWRTPSPVPMQTSTERKHSEGKPAEAPHVQQRHSLDAAWTERISKHSDLADQHEDHVHWAHLQRSSHQDHPHGSLSDEAHHLALGMSRRGSFFPGHSLSDDRQGEAGLSDRKDNHANQQYHGHVASGPARRQSHAGNQPGSIDMGSAGSRGYQPFSLKDYRDNDYDPKQRTYWTLGTLGKDPDTAEVQVGSFLLLLMLLLTSSRHMAAICCRRLHVDWQYRWGSELMVPQTLGMTWTAAQEGKCGEGP